MGAISKLLKAIPETWGEVSGELTAPPRLRELGKVSEVGLIFHQSEAVKIRTKDNELVPCASLAALDKLFGFIRFYRFRSQESLGPLRGLHDPISLIEAYIKAGYVGKLTFNHIHPCALSITGIEWCTIRITSPYLDFAPPVVEIGYEEGRGSPDRLVPIKSVITMLGMPPVASLPLTTVDDEDDSDRA